MIVLYIVAYLSLGLLAGWISNRPWAHTPFEVYTVPDALCVLFLWPVYLIAVAAEQFGRAILWVMDR